MGVGVSDWRLANGLLGAVGMEQQREGQPEPTLLTAGEDATRIAEFLPEGKDNYSAADVIHKLNNDHMGIKTELQHPHIEFGISHRNHISIEQRDVERYFKDLLDVEYEDKNQTPPSINVVLFLAGDENFSEAQEDKLKDYTRFFDGKYRIIRGLDQIQSARSAKETVN